MLKAILRILKGKLLLSKPLKTGRQSKFSDSVDKGNDMEKVIDIFTWKRPDCTMGTLTYGDWDAFTLELPWEDNKPFVSCIPEGTYKAKKYMSPSKKQTVLMLDDVPGRTYIQIHAGNYTRQIEGCILIGNGIKFLDKDGIPDISDSGNALKTLLELIPDEVTINIHRS